MPGHRIQGCPEAEEYVDAKRVTIVNRQLHLRTGSSSADVQPIHLTHPDWNPALTRRHGVDTHASSSSRAHTSATPMTTASLSLPWMTRYARGAAERAGSSLGLSFATGFSAQRVAATPGSQRILWVSGKYYCRSRRHECITPV